MRLLANENIPGETIDALRQAGHNVLWIGTESPGIDDRTVLARAQAESRILLTFDKDFGELAFRYGLMARSGIILLRLSAPSSAEVTRSILAILDSRDDWAGHFSVIDDRRIRMIPLPGQNH